MNAAWFRAWATPTSEKRSGRSERWLLYLCDAVAEANRVTSAAAAISDPTTHAAAHRYAVLLDALSSAPAVTIKGALAKTLAWQAVVPRSGADDIPTTPADRLALSAITDLLAMIDGEVAPC